MKLFYTFDICTTYTPALWYDDKSALTDEECSQIDEFIADLPECHCFQIAGDGEQDSHFTRDDITGLMADCYQIEVWV